MSKSISTKRRFVADGVFRAELHSFLRNKLAEDAYSGVKVVFPDNKNEVRITIQAADSKKILGPDKVQCHELQSVIERRFGFDKVTVLGDHMRPESRGLCPELKAEQIKAKLLLKLPVRKVAMGTIKHIMECKAKGVQVVISGKLTGQRAKATKYGDGFMIGSGDAKRDYLVEGVRHVLVPQGILGVKVRIMLPQSDNPPSNKFVKRQMDDYVHVYPPKDEQ